MENGAKQVKEEQLSGCHIEHRTYEKEGFFTSVFRAKFMKDFFKPYIVWKNSKYLRKMPLFLLHPQAIQLK